MICYRHCEYRTPLRTSFQPQARPGRYHRGTEPEPTQYLCLHPLGPHAEALRAFDARTPADARALDLRTWAVEVPTDELVEVPFAAPGRYQLFCGIHPTMRLTVEVEAASGKE